MWCCGTSWSDSYYSTDRHLEDRLGVSPLSPPRAASPPRHNVKIINIKTDTNQLLKKQKLRDVKKISLILSVKLYPIVPMNHNNVEH